MIGLLRERNESAILQDTLDHLAGLCDEGIIVYDDASQDDSPEIAARHAAVRKVLQQDVWLANERPDEETRHRATLVGVARQLKAEWALLMDADERLDLEGLNLQGLQTDGHDSLLMRLFDAYITPEDAEKPYIERRWWGPEYRLITFAFRLDPWVRYWMPDQREPFGTTRPLLRGSVKHYGKAISVEQWEETCDYYLRHWPAYAAKWAARKGKAIHGDYKSDWGRPLMRWGDRHEKGVHLEQ